MDSAMKRLCTICARGGSKGVPGKNIRPLAGRPLIAWTVLQARASGLFQLICVSSDSPDIRDAALAAGADMAIDRPADMAADSSAKVPAIRHAVLSAEQSAGYHFDTLVDLDATAPLRLPEDIAGAVRLLENREAPNVITGSPAHRSPYFNLVERRDDGTVGLSKQSAQPVVRRQDAPACFDMNASIYVWRRDGFIADPRVFYDDTLLYEMPAERSHDIDNELDFLVVEMLFEKHRLAETLADLY
jgi:N-acylneuraminate cytidylyltransferase/CMP-N,N'-diacetyllegionaminic acid synthase